jgi:hypothetical protein
MSTHKLSAILAVLLIASFVITSCATPTPQVVEKVVTQVVEKKVEVVQTKVVEVPKEATKVVQVEKVITATPAVVEYWKAEDVTKATGVEKCQPLATLPKKFKQPIKIGFVGFNNAHPFHGTFQKAAADAAKFYGAEFVNMDAAGNGGAIIDLANTGAFTGWGRLRARTRHRSVR